MKSVLEKHIWHLWRAVGYLRNRGVLRYHWYAQNQGTVPTTYSPEKWKIVWKKGKKSWESMELSTVVGCSIWMKRQSGKTISCSERTEKSIIVYWLSWVKNRNYLDLLAAPDGCALHRLCLCDTKMTFFFFFLPQMEPPPLRSSPEWTFLQDLLVELLDPHQGCQADRRLHDADQLQRETSSIAHCRAPLPGVVSKHHFWEPFGGHCAAAILNYICIEASI